MSITRMQWVSSLSRCFSLAVLLFAIAGCGFHRQGMAPMPEVMQVVYVESEDRLSDFQRNLRAALATAGSRLTDQRDAARAVLRIIKDDSGRRVLSVSARNTPREYELYYTVTYSVVTADQEILPPQTLNLTRNYSFTEQELLAKEHEEEILRQALARDLVGLVMRRLSSL